MTPIIVLFMKIRVNKFFALLRMIVKEYVTLFRNTSALHHHWEE